MAAASTAPRRKALGKGGAAIADQICSSASGLLLLVTAARAGDAANFGSVSVALICHGFALGCVRAFIGEIAMLRLRRWPERADANARVAVFLGLLAGLCATALFLAAGWVVGGDTGTYLGLMGVAAVPIYVQDVQRYLCFGTRRMGLAITIDATWLLVQSVIVVVLLVGGSATVERLVVAWVLGAAAGALVGLGLDRWVPSARGGRAWLAEDGPRGLGFVGDFVVSTGLVQAAMISLAVLLTLDEFGAIRLAFVSLSPLANLLAGVRALVLASLGGLRGSPEAARARAKSAAMVFASIGIAYGAVLVLIPADWGVAALGSGWRDAEAVVGIICVGEVLRLASFPAIDLLKVFRLPVALVTVRLVVTVLGVVALIAAALVGGPRLVAWAATASAAVAAVVWWRQASLDRLRVDGGAPGAGAQQEPWMLASPTPPG